MGLKRKRSKARFSPEERKTLFLAWERGFLCDNKNYRLLSEITGLTRKQISNWARTQIKKCNKADLPQKNFAPLRTIFKELSDCMQTDSGTLPPSHFNNEFRDYKPQNRNFEPQDYKPQPIKIEAQHHKPLHLNRGNKYLKEEVLSFSSDLPHQPHQHDFPYTTFRSISKVTKVPPMSLELFPQHAGELAPSSQYFLETLKTAASTVVPGASSRESFLTSCTSTMGESDRNLSQTSANNISSINQWVLRNALKGINQVDNKKVEILSILANTNYHDIIFYLLHNGWQSELTKRGIHYLRTEQIGKESWSDRM